MRSKVLVRISFSFVVMLTLSACMTRFAVLPPPLVAAPTGSAAQTTLGVAPTLDKRAEQEVGMIGALRIAVGGDLTNYIDGALKKRLNELGFNAVAAPDPQSLGTAKLEYVFNGKVVQVTIESVTMGTFDAILAPADTAVTLRSKVFDRDGHELFSKTQVGQHSERVGISVSGQTEGTILATATDKALDQLIADQTFKDAVR